MWSQACIKHFGLRPGDSYSTLGSAINLFCDLRNFFWLFCVLLSSDAIWRAWMYLFFGEQHFLNKDQVRKKAKPLGSHFLIYLSLLRRLFQCSGCCLDCCPSILRGPWVGPIAMVWVTAVTLPWGSDPITPPPRNWGSWPRSETEPQWSWCAWKVVFWQEGHELLLGWP